MTVTLELKPETEASLLRQAEALGLSFNAFLQRIIMAQAAAAAKPTQPLPGGTEELDRAIDEILDTVHVSPGVGQGVMLRENWYR